MPIDVRATVVGRAVPIDVYATVVGRAVLDSIAREVQNRGNGESMKPGVGRVLARMLLGILLYGGLSWMTSVFPIGWSIGGDTRPGVAVPLLFGLIFGPVVGFVTGAGGNLLGDALAGNLALAPTPPTGSVALDLMRGASLNWQIGNGLMGLVAGLMAVPGRAYRTPRDHRQAIIAIVVAVLIGMGFASGTGLLIGDYPSLDVAVHQSFLPVAVVDLLNGLILVPLLLFNRHNLDIWHPSTLRSGLVRTFAWAILIAAGLPIALLGFFLLQRPTESASDASVLGVHIGFTIVATLVVAVTNALLVAVSISRPVVRLTDAAQAIEAGGFTGEQAAALRAATGTDEVSTLTRLFGKMASEVIQREQALRQELEALKIEIRIDHSQKARDVAEVMGSTRFVELKRLAAERRARERSS